MTEPDNLTDITVANLKKLSPDVRDVKVTVRHDSSGDPTVYLTIILSNRVSDKAILNGKFRTMEKWIHETLWDKGGYQFWPYVTLRREREELELAGAR